MTTQIIDPLVIDIDADDCDGKPNLYTLVDAGLPWAGVILKGTEGTYYNGGTWLETYWPIAKQAAGSRYGVDFFRGAYHYIRVDESGVAQADYFLNRMQQVGGWGVGDLIPAIDVESSEQPIGTTKQQVIDTVSTMANRILSVTGRAPLLYGGSYLRSFGITDHMGCQMLWVPSWTATLPSTDYTNLGWTLANTLMWQYCGDGTAALAGYPHTSPIGPVDISAIIINGGGSPATEIMWTRTHGGTQVT
jgi:GH25 family lysozyme M1 (1,4-beta-N-acetylmuramidase)